MSLFQTFMATFATISLFLYGLKGFSKEVKEIGYDHFNKALGTITNYRLGGFFLGAMLTIIIQSSSAVSSITVALVDAGVITFYNSLAVMLGANVGTTSTAWLVTLKVGQIAPIFIVLGTVVSLVPAKINVAGKSVFYFGLILFSLELISQALAPLQADPIITSALSLAQFPVLAIIAGAVVTSLVQSSSVTAGLAIILAQQGTLTPEGAIAIIIGSNVGTTSTALIASLRMDVNAKKAAKANFIFNLIGVIVCYPLIHEIGLLSAHFANDIGFQVALAHLFFNILISVLMLPLLPILGNWLQKI